jgi:hypothetical protein
MSFGPFAWPGVATYMMPKKQGNVMWALAIEQLGTYMIRKSRGKSGGL